MRWKVAILTIESNDADQQDDTSVQVIRELVEDELAGAVIEYRTVPMEMDEIMAALIEMSDYHDAELIFTVGGIGLLSGEVTPEATRQIIEREIPGLPELIRSHLRLKSSGSVWYRGIAGARGSTMIVNLPQHPKGVHESLVAIMNQLPEGLAQLRPHKGAR